MPLAATIKLFLILLLPGIAAARQAATLRTALLFLPALLGAAAALLATALSAGSRLLVCLIIGHGAAFSG
jgi:hypothetical protein